MSNDRSLPVDPSKRWAELAGQFVEQEPDSQSTYLSTKGGIFKIGDDELGDQLCVVVVDAIKENTYYEGKFKSGEQNAPKCYAYGYDVNEMAPHESMQAHPDYFEPQNADCLSCPLNKWGSAAQGRGKACQNRRRLALIPAGVYHPLRKGQSEPDLDLYTDESHYREADLVTLKLPVTSVKHFTKYVNKLAESVRRPPFGVLTRIYTVPDSDDQFHIKFEMIEELPDDLLEVMVARYEAASASLIRPYSPPDEDQREERNERRHGIKGLRER